MKLDLETLVLQVTTFCPNHCPQCYMQKGSAEIPLDVAKRYVDFSKEYGALGVQITGGEPITYSDLSKLLRYVHEKEMYSFLATSGVNHSIEVYEALKTNGLDIICVSINDIDEQINNLSRDRYIDSICAIKDAICADLCCVANVVISDDNIDNFETLLIYLKKIGVFRVDILRPVPSFDRNYSPSISENTIQRLREYCCKYGEFLRVENCFKEYWNNQNHAFICMDVGNKAMFVNVDGSVSPCSKLQCYKFMSMDEMLNNRDIWKGGCLG